MGFFDKLKQGLLKTKNAIVGKIDDIIQRFTKVDEELVEELEELLISADVGVMTTEEILDELRDTVKDQRIKEPEQVKEELFSILRRMIGEHEALNLSTKPSVILVIGVNGVGKTTSIGKIAADLKQRGKKVVVAAADTFRAAASEQLSVWADRAKVRIVKHEEGSDPSAVIFDAVSSAKAKKTDVVIVDTAGRLHVKDNLMNELRKMDRVVTREYPEADFLKLLVLDATTGQNAVNQARVFDEAVELDGIVLTKLDGTAKGGFVFSLAQELSLPVIFAGVGEKIDDLEAFDSKSFVEAIL